MFPALVMQPWSRSEVKLDSPLVSASFLTLTRTVDDPGDRLNVRDKSGKKHPFPQVLSTRCLAPVIS